MKTILVPVTASDADAPAFGTALAVARAFGAHIEALYVRLDPVDVAVSMSADSSSGAGVFAPGLIEDLEKAGREREERARQAFAGFCTRAGLSEGESVKPGTVSADLVYETGQEERWTAIYGMTSDLVVASRGTMDDGSLLPILETVLMDSGRPLLIPAGSAPMAVMPDKVAIAWKPTPQAARAVAAALPFLTRASEVSVFTVEERQGQRDHADRLVRQLARHGLRVGIERLQANGRNPVETLMAAAQNQGVKLLVMGGYGHSRLREWVFGGFTQHVLADAPIPVLISH